mmetsp:Transcript_1840/g.5824  ORF Transcript_1840/g.5824 Transcript_1840/m.5824 type:complete len:262 (-) Transcript_1840:57-842(-)
MRTDLRRAGTVGEALIERRRGDGGGGAAEGASGGSTDVETAATAAGAREAQADHGAAAPAAAAGPMTFGISRHSGKALQTRLTPAEFARVNEARVDVFQATVRGMAMGVAAGPLVFLAARAGMGARAARWKWKIEGLGCIMGSGVVGALAMASARGQAAGAALHDIKARPREGGGAILRDGAYDVRREAAAAEAEAARRARVAERVAAIEAAERARGGAGRRRQASDGGEQAATSGTGWDGRSWYADVTDDEGGEGAPTAR